MTNINLNLLSESRQMSFIYHRSKEHYHRDRCCCSVPDSRNHSFFKECSDELDHSADNLQVRQSHDESSS